MNRWPTFTLRYLLLLIFWWAVALSMVREVVVYGGYELRGFICFLLSPIAIGAAYGGSVLKMRFGLIVGCIISALMLAYLGVALLFVALTTDWQTREWL